MAPIFGQEFHVLHGLAEFEVSIEEANHYSRSSSFGYQNSLGMIFTLNSTKDLNQAADSLSWVKLLLLSISKLQSYWWNDLQKEYIINIYYRNFISAPHYIQHDKIWYEHGKVSLNPTSSLLPNIISKCHSSLTGGHFCFNKTLSRLRSDFCWPSMQKLAMDFI